MGSGRSATEHDGMKASTAARILVGIGGFLLVGTLLVAVRGDPRAGDLARQVVFLLALGGGLFWLGRRFRVLPRRASFGDQADALSFHAEPGDPQRLLEEPFALFRWAGSVRAVENTATGTHGGRPTTIADYWFAPTGAERYDDYERYTCVIVDADEGWSDLSVVPERLASRTLGALGLRDQELESEAFNRAFHVRAAEPRFASAFVDARMMAWLLERDGVGFEILGGRLLLFRRRTTVSLDDLAATLDLYVAFRARIPGVVTAGP
jgi:hypothetical protein